MTYRRSRARLEFELQVQHTTVELAPIYKFAQKNGGGARLLAVYYIFAYSQLEIYVKSIVEDALGAFNSTTPEFHKWPDLMLGYLLHKSENLAADYRRFAVDEDEGALLKKVAQAARKVGQWSSGSVRIDFVNPSDFLEKKKYPSPKNLTQLFKRLGIEGIWAPVGKYGRMNGEMTITSLNDLRTGIAHEGKVPPGFSLTDFKCRMNTMRRLVAAIDRAVSNHFCNASISRSDWNKIVCKT